MKNSIPFKGRGIYDAERKSSAKDTPILELMRQDFSLKDKMVYELI